MSKFTNDCKLVGAMIHADRLKVGLTTKEVVRRVKKSAELLPFTETCLEKAEKGLIPVSRVALFAIACALNSSRLFLLWWLWGGTSNQSDAIHQMMCDIPYDPEGGSTDDE